MKSVQIRIFFWSVFSRTRDEYGKIRIRKNSVFGYFSCSGVVDKILSFNILNIVIFLCNCAPFQMTCGGPTWIWSSKCAQMSDLDLALRFEKVNHPKSFYILIVLQLLLVDTYSSKLFVCSALLTSDINFAIKIPIDRQLFIPIDDYQNLPLAIF